MESGDIAWILASTALVMLMTPGLGLFYGGMVRRKNVLSMISLCFLALAIVSIQWIIIGYTLSFGSDINGIIGSLEHLGLKNLKLIDYAFVAFQLMFAAITLGIVTSAMAERVKLSAFLLFGVLWTTFVYDPLAHWVWGNGWLAQLGALDFAGGTVVHISSGFSALALAFLIGKRMGYGEYPMEPHNIPMTLLGTALLWFGWFGFNPGSTLAADQLRISIIAANTNLAAAAAGATAMFITWAKNGKPDVGMTCNGVLGGLVAITAPCAWVPPWAAVIIGVIAGFIVCYGYWFLERHGIDDAVGAVPVHGFCGSWGLLALGIFADGTYGVYTTQPPLVRGLLFGNPGTFLCQVIDVIVNLCWAFGTGYLLFWILKKTIGIRVSPEEEIIGLDITEHATVAYPNFICTETGLPLTMRRGERR